LVKIGSKTFIKKERTMSKAPLYVAGTIFGFAALVHLYRLYDHFNIIVGNTEIPTSANVVGAIVAGALSLWMFSAACCNKCQRKE
jgi:hypothetical protein